MEGGGGRWREVEGGGGRWREVEGDGGRWREVEGGGGRWREKVKEAYFCKALQVYLKAFQVELSSIVYIIYRRQTKQQ